MVSIHHLTRFLSNLARESSALKPFLKTKDKYKTLEWKSDRTASFYRILKLVSKINENKLFDQIIETLVVCEASKFGLSAALEQFTEEGGRRKHMRPGSQTFSRKFFDKRARSIWGRMGN